MAVEVSAGKNDPFPIWGEILSAGFGSTDGGLSDGLRGLRGFGLVSEPVAASCDPTETREIAIQWNTRTHSHVFQLSFT